MLKKVIKFTDINGEAAEETAYFNLTNIELLRLSAKYGIKGDLAKGLKATIDAEDFDAMMQAIEGIILTAYGQRGADGNNGFVKNDKLRQTFSNSIPYSDFVIKLIQDPTQMDEFVTALTSGIKPLQPNAAVSAVQSPNA